MTDHMHPIFSQIMRSTQLAYGMAPPTPKPLPPIPRTPEEVRQDLSKQRAPAEFSADAI